MAKKQQKEQKQSNLTLDTAKKVSKKITLKDIEKEAKKFEEKKKVQLKEGLHVFIYPYFSVTKIAELIKEMLTDQERAKKEGIDFHKIDNGDWYLFNIIYKFTDLPIPNDIKMKVQAFKHLVETKYFAKIIEAFPKESLKDLDDALARFKENFDLIMKEKGFVSEDTVNELLEGENKIVQ